MGISYTTIPHWKDFGIIWIRVSWKLAGAFVSVLIPDVRSDSTRSTIFVILSGFVHRLSARTSIRPVRKERQLRSIEVSKGP